MATVHWFELSEEISRATGVPFAAPDSDDLMCLQLTSDDATDDARERLPDREGRACQSRALAELACR